MTAILDFEAQLQLQDDTFQVLNILDKEGKVLDSDLEGQVGLSDEQLVALIKDMLFSRTLNDRSTKLAKQGRLGFFAPTIGQEASQIASQLAFAPEDYLLPGYRDIPQLILHGLTIEQAFLWSRGHYDALDVPEELHVWFPQIVIGAQIIETAGIALGLKKKKTGTVAFTYTGDGGSSQGDTYEGINFAGAYHAPAVFFIQNNGFAISTPRGVQTAAPHLAAKGWAAGIPSIVVDGMDPLAMYLAAKTAREWAASGKGPVLIETLTSRFGPHSMSGDDPLRYRTQADLDDWLPHDPLIRFRNYLEAKGLWSKEQEQATIDELNAKIDTAVENADNVAKMKVSTMLKHTLEVPGQAMQEQIDYFEGQGK
ncbi:MAG: thiamine pyrophosphate-dependent dehydrogenase E1 component subunit alpha [Lactobacillaceae bacterium]|jgi:pyruvate dehydrogenase E1 component alpha subunit|nr:thiamine pyrophosphate-dependent dehydrogenase E1 component subunit alpha [Lactobacillaceae bacterium]